MIRAYIAFAAIVAATFAPAAQATGCRQVIRKAAVVEKVVVEKVFIEKVAAIAVPVVEYRTIPYYASYYNQPAPPPVQAAAAPVADNGELTNAIKVLVEEMRRTNERLDRLERGGTLPPMQPADPPPTRPMTKPPGDPFNPGAAAPIRNNGAAFASACITCHQPGGTGTKGPQGITLFDAGKRLVPGVEARMMTSVLTGRMPKDNPFSAEQAGQFVDGIDAHMRQGITAGK